MKDSYQAEEVWPMLVKDCPVDLQQAIVRYLMEYHTNQLTIYPSTLKALADHEHHESLPWDKLTVGQYAELIWQEDKYWPANTNGRKLKPATND